MERALRLVFDRKAEVLEADDARFYRSAKERAVFGSKASYKLAMLCVFRLSITKTTLTASGYIVSSSVRTNRAQSTRVRRSVTHAVRFPANGSTAALERAYRQTEQLLEMAGA